MDIFEGRDPSLVSILRLSNIEDSPLQVISSSDDKSFGTKEAIPTVVPNWENVEKHSKRYLEGSRPHQNGKILCL